MIRPTAFIAQVYFAYRARPYRLRDRLVVRHLVTFAAGALCSAGDLGAEGTATARGHVNLISIRVPTAAHLRRTHELAMVAGCRRRRRAWTRPLRPVGCTMRRVELVLALHHQRPSVIPHRPAQRVLKPPAVADGALLLLAQLRHLPQAVLETRERELWARGSARVPPGGKKVESRSRGLKQNSALVPPGGKMAEKCKCTPRVNVHRRQSRRTSLPGGGVHLSPRPTWSCHTSDTAKRSAYVAPSRSFTRASTQIVEKAAGPTQVGPLRFSNLHQCWCKFPGTNFRKWGPGGQTSGSGAWGSGASVRELGEVGPRRVNFRGSGASARKLPSPRR
jgi:hypothetical protein